MITYDDFAKLDIRIGEITSAEPVPETDKLMKLTVDLGEEASRTIVAGIAPFKSADELVGVKCAVLANLEPRTLRGVESQGMILAASDGEQLSLLSVDGSLPPGTQVS